MLKSGFHWLWGTTTMKHPSFYFCSLVYISNTFLRILADPKRAHLWINSMDVLTLMVLRFSFNLSGIVPNAPSTMGIAFVLMPHIFRISLSRWYFSTFSSSLAPTLPSSGIATSIIWQLFSVLSMTSRSDLQTLISWSVHIIKSRSIVM